MLCKCTQSPAAGLPLLGQLTSRRSGVRLGEEGAELQQPIAPPVDVDDMSVMQQPVEDRGGEDLVVGGERRPVPHVLVRRQDDAAAPVARGDRAEIAWHEMSFLDAVPSKTGALDRTQLGDPGRQEPPASTNRCEEERLMSSHLRTDFSVPSLRLALSRWSSISIDTDGIDR